LPSGTPVVGISFFDLSQRSSEIRAFHRAGIVREPRAVYAAISPSGVASAGAKAWNAVDHDGLTVATLLGGQARHRLPEVARRELEDVRLLPVRREAEHALEVALRAETVELRRRDERAKDSVPTQAGPRSNRCQLFCPRTRFRSWPSQTLLSIRSLPSSRKRLSSTR
jgi:hypothetical protein